MSKDFAYKTMYKCGCKIIAYEYGNNMLDEYTIFCSDCLKEKYDRLNKEFEKMDVNMKFKIDKDENIIVEKNQIIDDKILCECGVKYCEKYKNRHLNTKKHIEYVELYYNKLSNGDTITPI